MPKPSKTGVRGLYRGADGRYKIDLRWRDPTTGIRQRHREALPAGVNALAAKERARRILSAALAGNFDPKREAPQRLSKLLKDYLEWAELNRPASIAARRSHAKVIRKHLGNPLLPDLAPLHVERMKRDYKNGGRSPASANRVLATLKHMLGLAVNSGSMDGELVRRIRAVRLFTEPPGRVRYLSADEHRALMKHVPDELRPIVMTALLTGMRLSELLRVRVENADLDRRLLHVVKTKNGCARWIPINDALARLFETQLDAARNGWVFPNEKGRRHRSDTISKAFKKLADAADLHDFHFHDIRHDFATRVCGARMLGSI